MSTRWSYGPEGLREIRVTSRWGAEWLWPRWHELQPFLLRSAGVVGLAGMIVAVISSNGWRPEGSARDVSETLSLNSVQLAARSEPAPVPILAAGQRQKTAADTAAAQPPEADAVQPGEPDPIAGLATAAPWSASEPKSVETIAAASDDPAPATVAVAALEPATTASTRSPTAYTSSSAWADDASACPRDWLAEGPSPAQSTPGDCAPTSELIAALVDDDQATLEEAADRHARELAALVPFVPRPRPEPPADFTPTAAPTPVDPVSATAAWPSEPPPNCDPGLHAFWRYAAGHTGGKEWYCK